MKDIRKCGLFCLRNWKPCAKRRPDLKKTRDSVVKGDVCVSLLHAESIRIKKDFLERVLKHFSGM